MVEDGSIVWEIIDEVRKLGTSYIGRFQYVGEVIKIFIL